MLTRIRLAVFLGLVACAGSQAVNESRALLRQGDLPAAEARIDRALALDPRDEELLELKLHVQIARGDVAGAVARYLAWRGTGSDSTRLLRGFGLAITEQALTSPSDRVRRDAIVLAETHKLEPLADAVTQRLGDSDPVVRVQAAGALLGVHPDATTILADGIDNGPPEARAIAYEALGRRIGARAQGEIRRGLADASPVVRRAACRALGRIDAGPLDEVVTLVSVDPDASVRAEALSTLTARKVDRRRMLAKLALGDAYLGVRLAAVQALAEHPDDLRPLLMGPDLSVALAAAGVLARDKKSDELVAVVKRALAATEWTVRAAGLNQLAHLVEAKVALPLAESATKDEQAQVRLAAVRAMARLGKAEPARTLFLELLGSTEPAVRTGAALELHRTNDARGARALAVIVKSGAFEIRSQVAWGIATTRPLPQLLLELLADPDPRVRLAVTDRLLTTTQRD